MKLLREVTDAEREQGYYQHGAWKGQAQFNCMFCAFDSFNDVSMREHLIKVHQFALIDEQKKVAMSVPLYDGSGRLIEEREV
jgi:hypothetical protein